MKTIVIYASNGGNTQKVAETIASELNCEALKISKEKLPALDKLNGYDLVFVGTGIRAGNVYPELQEYLESLSMQGAKRFALFLTWGGAGKTDQMVITKLKTILQGKGQVVSGDCFKSLGGRFYSLASRGHPNKEDLQAAKEWARKQLEV